MFGLWFGLHDLDWPFAIFLRSLMPKKSNGMHQLYIRALFQLKQFPHEISHFGSVWHVSKRQIHKYINIKFCNSPNFMEKTCILYIDTNPLYNHLVVFKLVCNHLLSTCLVAFSKIICKHLFTYSSYMLLDSTDDAVICECRSKVLKFDQSSKMFWNLQYLHSKFCLVTQGI